MDEGAAYGDDAQMASNYPIVSLTSSSGTVYYATTSNWSSPGGVQTGTNTETTNFTLPSNVNFSGVYAVRVIANGITSNPVNLTIAGSFTGDILGWNVTGQSNYGTQDLAATTVASGITNSLGLTRGSGVNTSGGGAASNAWGGKNWASTSSNGISGNELVSYGLTVGTGEEVSLSAIDMNYRRASGGPTNGLWQYQIDGGAWTNIADVSNEFSSTSSSGAAISPISLTGISALQNLAAGTVLNIRVVPYGATSSSAAWYVYDLTGDDLILDGSVNSSETATTTTITSNTPNPSTVGQPVAFNVTVNGGVPNGETVTLEDASNGNAVVGTGTLTSGATTINVSSLSIGTHDIFAVYAGDSTYAPSQSSQVVQTVDPLGTVTTLVDNGPNPSTSGQSVSFTATVSPTVPDGESVSLKDASNGNAVVASGVLTNGAATINVSSLSVGTHDLFAVYAGDATYATSQSSQVIQTVNAISTTTTLADNGPNPSTGGQSVNFTVAVSPTVPNGESVSLEDASNGNAVVATGTLASGTATINISTLSAGTHDLFAVYGGDSTHAGSQSGQVVQTVNALNTTTTLTDNGPNPSTGGQSVSFTVTVSPAVANGESVSLEDASNGNAVVGTGTLASGSATINISTLLIGTHDLFAVYGGDAIHTGSQSSQVVQTVNPISTATTLTDNGPNPSIGGQAVSFTVTVSPAVPNGESVSVEDASNGNALVGTGTLASGSASINVSTLSAGTHDLFAIYGGDATHTGSQSSQVVQVVTTEILGWNVAGQSNYGTQGLAATMVAAGITNSLGLTRGSGVSTSGSAASNAWGGRNWASTSSNGISGNEYASFGMTVSAGEVVSLSTIDMNYRRGSQGPPSGLWQYQLSGGAWTNIIDVTNEFPSTSGTGAAISAISLAGISAVQNLAAGAVVNIRVVPYGSTSTLGPWYVYDLPGDDLIVGGTVTPVQTATTTTITFNAPNPSTAGQAVAFNVSVNGGVPNGETVTLEDASNSNAVVGTGTLTSGSAAINVSSLAVGTHDIFAVYGGDASYAASQSSEVVQTVNLATTTTVSTDQAGPYSTSSSLTFTATITGDPSVGTVTFYAGPGLTNQIGASIAVVNGAADSTPGQTFPAGGNTVTAVYSGGTGFAGSQGTDTFQVSAPPPSISNVVINQDISALFNAAGQPTAGMQRSMVNDIVYTFSEAVNIASPAVDPNVFTVAVASGWTGTAPAALEWSALAGTDDTQWEVDFGGASIANGAYTITLNHPASITAASDGQAVSLTAGGIDGATQSFYRLFGDINGDQFVNASDNLQLKQALTTYNAAFDFNQDGFVNASDNIQFKNDLSVNFSGFTPTI